MAWCHACQKVKKNKIEKKKFQLSYLKYVRKERKKLFFPIKKK